MKKNHLCSLLAVPCRFRFCGELDRGDKRAGEQQKDKRQDLLRDYERRGTRLVCRPGKRRQDGYQRGPCERHPFYGRYEQDQLCELDAYREEFHSDVRRNF